MPSLRHDEAMQRAALLAVDRYTIDLDLTGAATEADFGSAVTIEFACREPGAATFAEVRPARLDQVTLNGVELAPTTLTDNRLPLTDLERQNSLTVRARMAYSNAGVGLHRFTDPEDGRVYLYAQSFLDEAQALFACFDQPDLKARFRLRVDAPVDWEVAANAPGQPTAPGRWEFDLTEPLSTYFVTLIAGPYHVRRAHHDGIPLALYCRRGLSTYLDDAADEIFDITRACLDRYHELFGVRYPFHQYGQAFVPEFNAGAMENPGLVTIRDEFVYRGAVTDAELGVRALVIAHEMAHMWFGDLVTMRWWDDLWLNESFAEYMGHRMLVEATRFTDGWTEFAVARKGWGYADDQRPSTHPVAPETLADASLALLNFDGISYAKGAATLRQLAVWIGDDAFIAGLRAYFAAHAFGNATLDDLLAALSEASGRDLASWAKVWWRQAQVNTLRPEVTLDSQGRYAEVNVVQTAPADYPTVRPHHLAVGVYSGGLLTGRAAVDIDPTVDNGRTPVPSLTGMPAGDLLLVNDGDLTFAKIRFDPASREALPRTLPRLVDPLSRALVWAAVCDAVRDAESPAAELVELCRAALPEETSEPVFRDVVRFALNIAIDCYLPEAEQTEARALIAAACRAALRTAEPGGGHQLLAARGYVAAAGLGEAIELLGWINGGSAPEGLRIDAELRWTVLTRLCVLGLASRADIDAEYERDHTAAGSEYAARCRAALPDEAAKAAAWRVIVDDDQLSGRLVLAAAEGFWQPEQAGLTAPYVQRFFDDARAMVALRPPTVSARVADVAYPRYAVSQSTVEQSERLLAAPDVPAPLYRSVVDSTDDLRRALAARRLSGAGAHAHVA
jgi:aminopeptidase N